VVLFDGFDVILTASGKSLESHLLESTSEFPGDDKFLDLRGSFVNLEDFSIAHQFLHWVFRVKSIPTKNLQQ